MLFSKYTFLILCNKQVPMGLWQIFAISLFSYSEQLRRFTRRLLHVNGYTKWFVCVHVFFPHWVSSALMLRITDYFIFSTRNTNLFKFRANKFSLIFPFNHSWVVGRLHSVSFFLYQSFLSPFLVFAIGLLLLQPALYVC